MANEDTVNVTPHPPFTPKPWPPPCYKKKPKLIPVAESSEVEIRDDDPDFDKTPLTPVTSEGSITEDELAVEDESSTESDNPVPPVKKQKIWATQTAGTSAKVVKKKKQVDGDEKVVDTSDEEETPKLKKVKAKIHNEINSVAKKMENEGKGDKYVDMVKSMSNKQAEWSGVPAPKAPLQLQAAGGGRKKLKREGAIACKPWSEQ